MRVILKLTLIVSLLSFIQQVSNHSLSSVKTLKNLVVSDLSAYHFLSAFLLFQIAVAISSLNHASLILSGTFLLFNGGMPIKSHS